MKNIIYLIASLFILQSCRTDIDLNFKDKNEPAIIVEGFVTAGNPITKINLTTTVLYNSGQKNPPATDVEYVKLKRIDSFGNITYDTLSLTNPLTGEYKSQGKYIPTVGDKYELEFKFKGEIFKAESQINRTAIVDSIGYKFEEETFRSPAGYNIVYLAKDLPNKGEYFWFEKIKNGKPYWETISDKFVIWNDLFGDNLIFPQPVTSNLNPILDSDSPKFDENKFYPYTIGDTVIINCYSIDEKAYRFYNDFVQQSTSAEGGALGPLFSPPMDNIRTNLYNTNPKGIKVLGLFSARSVVSAQIIIK